MWGFGPGVGQNMVMALVTVGGLMVSRSAGPIVSSTWADNHMSDN